MKPAEDPDSTSIERLKKLCVPLAGTLLVAVTGLVSTSIEPEKLTSLLLGVSGLLLYAIWHHVVVTSRLKAKIASMDRMILSSTRASTKIPDPIPERLNETQEKILVFMGEIRNGLAAEGVDACNASSNEIAIHLNVGVVTAEVYLNDLKKAGYMQESGGPFKVDEPWKLSEKGMVYLVEHQLVG
jgi:hypothetical protein